MLLGAYCFALPCFIFSPCLPLGQVISADKQEIIKAYYPGYFMQAVEGQIHTKQVQAAHDDSYQGKNLTWLFNFL